MKVLLVIPARYASSRLMGKPLLKIGDKPMVVHVYHQAQKANLYHEIIVATDHQLIYDACQAFGCSVIMTSDKHLSGTDRVIEVSEKLPNFNLIINIQGDEPFIHPQSIDQLIKIFFDKPHAEIATLVKQIDCAEELWADSVIKCVKDTQGRALYFSRSVIPYLRNVQDKKLWHQTYNYWKHIGIYGYTQKALQKIKNLSTSSLEQSESLEQLRWLENGLSIFIAETSYHSLSVDTMEDYHNAITFWEQFKRTN